MFPIAEGSITRREMSYATRAQLKTTLNRQFLVPIETFNIATHKNMERTHMLACVQKPFAAQGLQNGFTILSLPLQLYPCF